MPGAPTRLRCEYLDNPIGIDEPQPRLSWWLTDERPAEIQTSYQIVAASTRQRLDADDADVWHSGRVASPETAQIPFAGGPLVSMQRVWWKVRSFDSDGVESDWSEPATFEMGLLEARDWRAQWISTPVMGGKRTPTRVPLLRRSFELTQSVERARLHITALGVYDVEINGQRTVDTELAPGWTDYRKRVRYQTYDVTACLRTGENVIGAWLGDGWYCGFLGLSNRQQYGDRPALLAQLEIVQQDGTRLVIGTDFEWRWQQSEILYSDLLDGESVDARQRRPGFSDAGYDASAWQPVEIVDPGTIVLEAGTAPMIRTIEEIRGSLVRAGRGLWLFDLGENIVGRVRLRVKAPEGTVIQLRFAERLDADDTLYTDNLRTARAMDVYTCAGIAGGETFEPRFTCHGFQYVEVSGSLSEGNILELTGVVLSSDIAAIGTFECDQQQINQLQHNIVRSQRGNFLDVPTACPQRDERLGWTGDAQVFARTAAFNLDVAGFFSKWLVDLSDAQTDEGVVPPVAPLPPELSELHIDGGPGWSDAVVICPWTVYRCCGDRRVLERNYSSMTRFINNLEARFPKLIRADPDVEAWQGFGDWLATDGATSADPRMGATPRDLIGTAYFCYSARLLARIAGVLGNLSDLERYEELAQRVRTAFRRRFVTADGRVVAETQTGYVLALHFGLLDGDERGRALQALVREIEDRDGHLSTGLLGTPYLLHVLTHNGRLDLAYRLLLQDDAPGWLYPITQGATSMWERWDGWTRKRGFQDPSMNSFNHYALGAVGEWLYGALLGLDVDPDLAPARNAYRFARIQPQPPIGEGFAEGAPIKRAEGRLDTLFGRYEVAWQLSGAEFELRVRIPPNCRATVLLPDGSSREVVAGEHEFNLPLDVLVDDGIPVLRELSDLESKAG